MASLNMIQSTLKACVISNPDGVDEDRLNSEFSQLIGINIPWKDHGFKSLQALIQASPSLQIITRGGRRLVVAETDSVEHLSAMISTQRKPSKKRRTRPRINQFFQKRMSSHKSSPNYRGSASGGNYSSYVYPKGKPVLKKIDFLEKNNNSNMKSLPVRNNKEVTHYSNARPAGYSSGSGSSSPTFTTPPEPKIKESPPQKVTQKQAKEKEKKVRSTEPVRDLPKETAKQVQDKNKESLAQNRAPKPPSLVSNDIVQQKNNKPTKLKAPVVPTTSPKLPLLPTPVMEPQGTYCVPVLPASVTAPATSNTYTRQSQRILSLATPDVIPPEPVIYFSPILPLNHQNNFVPDNLVPPKPMKHGSSYRGSKRRPPIMRSKLMSIKDDSTPNENSLTAKFINLIKAQDWPDPEYRLLPRIGPNKMEVYGCTVRGSYSLDNNETLLTYDYSTIPDEFSDKNASKEAVSQKAFEDMNNKIKEAFNYVPFSSNTDQMIERVYNMVSGFAHGLWAYKVESDYKNQFGERLPNRWVEIIANTDLLVAEKLADFSYVIVPSKQSNVNVLNISSKEMSLGDLEYPETETWDIYVTKIVSSSEVWFRFVGPNYSDWLDEVTKQMCDHYQNWDKFLCPSPQVDEVYVYPSNVGAVRVKVLSLDSPNVALVMHIDHGDIEEIPINHLCVLDYNFKKLPPQAVCCKMYDLDEYFDNKLCTAFLIDKVEGMVLVAEITQTEPLELIMFDTSSDDPVNLNQAVIKALQADITTRPSFSQDLIVQDGVVTSIWKTGEIYLQLPNEGLNHLNRHLKSIADIQADLYLAHVEDVVPEVYYLIEINGSWLRASILPPARPINNMVELLLIDTGDLATVAFTELVPLYLVSMVLCEIPRQALRVRLGGVNIYEDTVERLHSLIPPPCNTLIKVLSLEPVLEVELHIRATKGLISINNTLLLEENLSKNLNSVSLNNPSTEYVTIKPTPTPAYLEFFDVYVVSVSNPSNFTVIPRKYINELTKLQDKLQEFYNNTDPGLKKLRNFSVGQACAVQHSDGQWYRGLIEQIIDTSMSQLMIRFCDFGNFAMISAERLHSLDDNFLYLPALGINASIADIEPISGDWEFADCMRTQKLMLEKNLVTVIKSKLEEKGQIFLKLQVFDTSGDIDCDIGFTLVEESRAKYIF